MRLRKPSPIRPPSGTPEYIELLGVPDPPHSITVQFRETPHGVLKHWMKERGVPCPGAEECPSIMHKARTDWVGYCSVDYWRPGQEDWFPYVLECTEALYELLCACEIVGATWRLRRVNNLHGNRQCSGEEVAPSPANWDRRPFPVLPILLRVFHVQEIALDVAPHLPARIRAEALKGAPPPQTAPRPPGAMKPDIDPEEREKAAQTLRQALQRRKLAAGRPPAEENGAKT